jgi:hypothetical protein
MDCSNSPAAASCPETVKVTITTSVDHLKTQETTTFIGTAMHTRAGSVPVTQWSSDAPQVATVESSSGKVTGVTAGKATVIAEHDAQRDTKLVHVVPNFQGGWVGDYLITACTDSGDFKAEGFCQGFAVNTDLAIMASLTQNGDAAQGTLTFGTLPATVLGTVDDANALMFADATITIETLTIKIVSAKFTVAGADRLGGTFRATWSDRTATGSGEFDGRLNTVVRISTSLAPMSMRYLLARSWRDLAAAIRSR